MNAFDISNEQFLHAPSSFRLPLNIFALEIVETKGKRHLQQKKKESREPNTFLRNVQILIVMTSIFRCCCSLFANFTLFSYHFGLKWLHTPTTICMAFWRMKDSIVTNYFWGTACLFGLPSNVWKTKCWAPAQKPIDMMLLVWFFYLIPLISAFANGRSRNKVCWRTITFQYLRRRDAVHWLYVMCAIQHRNR